MFSKCLFLPVKGLGQHRRVQLKEVMNSLDLQVSYLTTRQIKTAWRIMLCTAQLSAWAAEWFNLTSHTQISNWGLLSSRESYYLDWVTL